MRPGRDHDVELNLNSLPKAAREALVHGRSVPVTRDGEPLGHLEFHPRVIEGALVAAQPTPDEPGTPEAGVRVVVMTMKATARARARLSEAMGGAFIVVDFREAPSTADVVLTQPVSPQLLGRYADMFPNARIIVTEIDDEEIGGSWDGPVARMISAGAESYLLAASIDDVATSLRTLLDRKQLAAGRSTIELSGPAGSGS